MARFFLSAPEPLALPHGWAYLRLGPPNPALFEGMRDSAVEVAESGQLVVDHTNDRVLLGNIVHWRSSEQSSGILRMRTAFLVANAVLSKQVTDDLERGFVLESGNGASEAHVDMPSVDSSVFDVAVPLFEHDDDPDAVASLSDAFDRAVDLVRLIQRGYHMIRRDPITMLAREKMPPTVPFVIEGSDDQDQADEPELNAFWTNTNLWSVTREGVLQSEDLQELDKELDRNVRGAPFRTAVEFRREADVALRREGDYRGAVVWTATAAETFFDDLLLHLMWEEKRSPETCIEPFIGTGLASRVRTEFHRRLGGNWNFSGIGPIAKWSSEIATVRHKIVHAGYNPTEHEAAAAFEAYDAVVTYAADLLAKRLRKYPRAAATLLGAPGLTRRFGSVPRIIWDLWDDPKEPVWGDTFDRWRATHARLRQDAEGLPRPPQVENSYLYAVSRPDGSLYWCLHDVIARMAAIIDGFDGSSLPPEHQDSLPKMLEYIRKHNPSEAISMGYPVDMWDGSGTLGQWKEEYHLVPMAGVMVDRSDLDI